MAVNSMYLEIGSVLEFIPPVNINGSKSKNAAGAFMREFCGIIDRKYIHKLIAGRAIKFLQLQ